MEEKKPSFAGFIDVAVSDSDEIYLLAATAISPENIGTKICRKTSDNWRCFDFPDMQLMRICARGQQIFAVSADGKAVIIENDNYRVENLPREVSEIGNITSLKNINGAIFVCGVGGQIYKYENDKWIVFDKELFQSGEEIKEPEDMLNYKPRYITDIDGFGEKNLYAVGLSGLFYHYNGEQWEKIKSPTDMPVNVMICDNEKIYLGGNNGEVFIGDEKLFNNYRLSEKEHIWGMAVYKNELYVSTLKSIYKMENDSFNKLDANLNPLIIPYRLLVSKNQLWSVSQADIAYFENNAWRRLDIKP